MTLPDKPALGHGYITIPHAKLMKALSLSNDTGVEGVKWNAVNQTLKVTVQSLEIPLVGGEIVATNPIHTEKELRDAEVARRLQAAEQA